VSPQEITTDSEKLKFVWKWPTTKNKHEIRSFLAVCTYYGRFISGFANIAKPLAKLTGLKQVFLWTPELEAAFQILKKALCTVPILAYQQPTTVVDSDASTGGTGGVLSQIQDGHE
jgi:hypothetical protein